MKDMGFTRFQAVNRSNAARKTFGLQEGDSLESNAAFKHLTVVVRDFFHTLIATNQLEQLSLQTNCTGLGRKHMKEHGERGFKAIFWDAFLVSEWL